MTESEIASLRDDLNQSYNATLARRERWLKTQGIDVNSQGKEDSAITPADIEEAERDAQEKEAQRIGEKQVVNA